MDEVRWPRMVRRESTRLRTTQAMLPEDPRTRRLRSEYEQILELKARSDLINFEHFLVVPDVPPERYVVTFTCHGIASIDDNYQPQYSDEHKVAIYLDGTYPTTPPRMKWLPPIWHPNIEHVAPHRVCIDNRWWTPGRTLAKVMPAGGCGTYACARNIIIFRAGNITLWDYRYEIPSQWARLRTGCSLSAIPAAGMQLAPEAGASVDVAFTAGWNDYRGRRSLQLLLKDLRPSEQEPT